MNEAPFPVEITAQAGKIILESMKETLKEEKGPRFLRVGVRGGGCSGLEYIMDVVEEKRDTDILKEQWGFDVIVDPISATHLQGTTIDFIKSLMGSGFKFDNPGAQRTCGCGKSFG